MVHSAARSSSVRHLFRYQKIMIRVVIATIPVILGSVYFFGWRSLTVILLSIVCASFTEWLFCRARKEPISSAVFVTAILYALILPPSIPYSAVIIGIVVGIVFGKEVFGGFGRNVFNPAMVGRCFLYVCFPVEMTARWLTPYAGAPGRLGGLGKWAGNLDAVTRATPLWQYKDTAGETVASLKDLFLGNVGGCLGETSALLILIGAGYLLFRKTASWRIVVSCVVGALISSASFHYLGFQRVPGPLFSVFGGGFLFAAVFMATDPISAAQTNEGRYIYGFGIGLLTVIIRAFSNFAGGVMFSILFMNMFNPILDHYIREAKKWRGASGEGEVAVTGDASSK